MILRNMECKVNCKFHIIIPIINPSYPHDIPIKVPWSANPLIRSRLQGGLGRLQDLILAAIGLAERKLQSQVEFCCSEYVTVCMICIMSTTILLCMIMYIILLRYLHIGKPAGCWFTLPPKKTTVIWGSSKPLICQQCLGIRQAMSSRVAHKPTPSTPSNPLGQFDSENHLLGRVESMANHVYIMQHICNNNAYI